jgi:broad specificity phosphatase PhoE
MADSAAGIYLIRHADALPEAGVALDDGARYDDLRLSARGREQAALLAKRLLRTVPLVAVYASPAFRALATAQAVAERFGYAVGVDERLREVGLAHESVDHLPAHERAAAVRAQLEMLARLAMREGSWSSLPGTEAGAGIRSRMRAAVEDVSGRHPDGAVAVVSHAGSINAFVADVLEIERDFFFPTGNTSITLVRIASNRRVLVRLNDTAHLERQAE